MIKRLLLIGTGAASAGIVLLSLLTASMLRRLPKPGRVALDGVTTVDDAVEACRRTGLKGWDLVTYAQQLAARKFTYSRLNTWDTPARAFERGMGYCEQQALALKQIYDQLGIDSRPVFALRCHFPGNIVDGVPWPGGVTGHAWLQVRVGNDERSVCPSSLDNRPGITQFQVLSKVYTLSAWLQPWTHLGSSIENIRRDWVARHPVEQRARRHPPKTPAPAEAAPERAR